MENAPSARSTGLRRTLVACLLAATAPGLAAPAAVEAGRTPAGLYYEASGAGAPVILAHGFSLDRRMWDEQIAVLEPHYRVIRYDLRGHGKSVEPREPFSAYGDLLEVCDALGVERATIVGLSAGAEAAIDFAIAHPERVARLVLASPGLSGYVSKSSFKWMAEVMAALERRDAEEAMRQWVETPLMRLADPAAHARMREVVTSNWKIWTYSAAFQKRLDPPANGRLTEIQAPTLVLLGEDDLPDTLAVGELIAANVAGAEKVALPSAGHLLNLAAPVAFNHALLRFLAGESSAGAERTNDP